MLPFRVDILPGHSLHRQVVFAIERAIVSGRLRPGDRFPSVRNLSRELKINPNTAHKVVATLVGEGLLEVRPGIGTMISEAPAASERARAALLGRELERLVVEARKLSLDLDVVVGALEQHWRELSRQPAAATPERTGRERHQGGTE